MRWYCSLRMSTSARLLRLLSLLQTPRDWTGTELADRLEVSQRTIRNDIERLRALGYPVHATRGSIGGYRLEAGATLPPLLLEDEEAVAVAIGLRTATGGAVTGIEETSLRALAKLEQVLPPRLRVGSARSRLRRCTSVAGRADGRSRGAHRARPDLPGAPPPAVRLLGPEGCRLPAPSGARAGRQLGPALVPRRLGHGPDGLADVPCRPDRARHVGRAAIRVTRDVRSRGRGARLTRGPATAAATRRGSPSTPLRRRWPTGSGRGSGR